MSSKWAFWAVIGAILMGTGHSGAQDPTPESTPPPAKETQPLLQFAIPDGSLSNTDTLTGPTSQTNKDDPTPLTLWNFFSEGWGQEFTRRSTEDRAPDFALLRVQTNFMEREFRVNYAATTNVNSTKTASIDTLDMFVNYAFDRRFMIGVFGTEQWINEKGLTPDEVGPTARLVGRVQLVSTADSSYTFNFQAIAPDSALGVHDTTVSYGLAGFEDLTRFGLYRVGLYGSVLFDSLDGPHAVGATKSDVEYDITIAKTLTRPDMPLLGNFTVFLETFAQTNLSGTHDDSTLVTLTPGVRFNLGKLPWPDMGLDNSVLFGTDIPVAGPKPYNAVFRFTYIKNF